MTTGRGASAGGWAHFSQTLGLTADLLPVVADPATPISPHSALKALGKTPSRLDRAGQATGIHQWTQEHATEAQVAGWSRDARLGICLQTRTVRALDVDVADPEAAQAIADTLEMLLGPLPWRTRADSGKRLALVRVADAPEIHKRVVRVAGGIVELLGNGQQCVVDSTHPGGARYEWLAGWPVPPMVTLEDLDAAWAAVAAEHGTGEAAESRGVALLEKPRRAVDALPDPVLDHLEADGWVLGHAQDGKVYVRCPLEDAHSSDNGPTQAAWLPAGVGGKAEGRFHCMHTGHGPVSTSQFLQLVGYVEDVAAEFESVEPVVSNVAADPFEGDLPNFQRDAKSGAILPTVGNTLAALASPPACRARIALDDFQAALLVAWQGADDWRPFTDTDYTRLREHLERIGFVKLGSDLVRECVALVAERHRFDSAQQWVQGLVWDGVPRVERFFVECFGVEDSPYTRAVGRYVWSALAGRALVPGCKVDMTPVLIGGEGQGKTSAVEAIAPTSDAFVELSLDVKDEGLARLMRGKLVAELAELRGLAGRDAEAVRAWFTRRVEEWVPKYKEFGTKLYRRFVIFGTGNVPEFLDSSATNRRFLPMTVTGTPDAERVARERDQLWAEGLSMFLANGREVEWRAAMQLATAERENFEVKDEWLGVIEAWLAADAMDETGGDAGVARGAGRFQIVDVAAGALGIRVERVNKVVRDRIGVALKRLGYANKVVKVKGKSERAWVHTSSVERHVTQEI